MLNTPAAFTCEVVPGEGVGEEEAGEEDREELSAGGDDRCHLGKYGERSKFSHHV